MDDPDGFRPAWLSHLQSGVEMAQRADAGTVAVDALCLSMALDALAASREEVERRGSVRALAAAGACDLGLACPDEGHRLAHLALASAAVNDELREELRRLREAAAGSARCEAAALALFTPAAPDLDALRAAAKVVQRGRYAHDVPADEWYRAVDHLMHKAEHAADALAASREHVERLREAAEFFADCRDYVSTTCEAQGHGLCAGCTLRVALRSSESPTV